MTRFDMRDPDQRDRALRDIGLYGTFRDMLRLDRVTDFMRAAELAERATIVSPTDTAQGDHNQARLPRFELTTHGEPWK